MNWLDSYKSKLVTAAEAVQKVETGDRVYYGGNAAIPFALVRALADRKDELENVQLNHVLLIGDDPLSEPEMAGHASLVLLFVTWVILTPSQKYISSSVPPRPAHTTFEPEMSGTASSVLLFVS